MTCSTVSWTENMIRRLAGTLVLTAVILAWKVHPGFIGLAAFVGLNLVQSSFTGFCPVELLFQKIDPTRKRAGAADRA